MSPTLVTVPVPPLEIGGKSFVVNLRKVGRPVMASGPAYTTLEPTGSAVNVRCGYVVVVVTLEENNGGNPVAVKLVTVPNPLFVPPIPNHAKS